MSLDVASYIIGNGKIYAQKFCDDKGCHFPEKTGCGVVFQKRKWWYGLVSVAFLETDSFHRQFTCWSPFCAPSLVKGVWPDNGTVVIDNPFVNQPLLFAGLLGYFNFDWWFQIQGLGHA